MALGDDFSLGNMSPLQLGGGAAALGGLGYMMSQGPGKLPPQFLQLESQVPQLQGQGQQEFAQGQALFGQGEEALAMAQAGHLTAPQQAELGLYSKGLTNQSRQMFYNMGRNPDADTAFLGQTAYNDQMIMAMAQKEIQTTLQIGLGEISGGSSLMGQGLGFENAANQALLMAGNAQLQEDKDYSNNLMSAFGAIGKMFGGFFGMGGK